MTNVHEFDGKVQLPYLQKVLPHRRKTLLVLLATLLQHADAKRMCVLITNQIGKVQDVDPKNNNYQSSLLLTYCFLWVPLEALEEQLLDMFRTGRCIQGQVVRFSQLLLCFV